MYGMTNFCFMNGQTVSKVELTGGSVQYFIYINVHWVVFDPPRQFSTPQCVFLYKKTEKASSMTLRFIYQTFTLYTTNI